MAASFTDSRPGVTISRQRNRGVHLSNTIDECARPAVVSYLQSWQADEATEARGTPLA